MTRSNFPEVFGIIRHQAYGGPRIQYLRAELHTGGGVRGYYYKIKPLEDDDEVLTFTELHYQINSQHLDPEIYKLRYMHPEFYQVSEVNYWYLPLTTGPRANGIPFLDFQYRSWIPITTVGSFEIPLDEDMVERFQTIQQRRLAAIQENEDRMIQLNWSSVEDRDDRRRIPISHLVGAGAGSRRPTPPVSQPVRIVERIIERVVTTVKPASLPKSVGDILLANARKGTESCPISTTPFSECGRLSVTSCFHIFEFASLARWCEHNKNCPVCRSNLENVVSEER